jgi:hypothetical protein
MERPHRAIPVRHRGRQAFVAAIAVGLFSGGVYAQEIRIKVLDGRNGHSIKDDCISVWVGSTPYKGMAAPTHPDGMAVVRLTRDPNKVSRPTEGVCNGLGAVDPLLEYGKTIRITSNYYMPCQPHPPDSPWLSFSVEKVLRSGDVSANYCGKIEASPKPGQIIVFVRPLHWWEAFRR